MKGFLIDTSLREGETRRETERERRETEREREKGEKERHVERLRESHISTLYSKVIMKSKK